MRRRTRNSEVLRISLRIPLRVPFRPASGALHLQAANVLHARCSQPRVCPRTTTKANYSSATQSRAHGQFNLQLKLDNASPDESGNVNACVPKGQIETMHILKSNDAYIQAIVALIFCPALFSRISRNFTIEPTVPRNLIRVESIGTTSERERRASRKLNGIPNINDT